MEPSPQARKILSELKYDFRAFTIDHFIGWIEQTRQRKIIAIPWQMPPGMFGAWMSDGDEPREYIFYRNDVPQIHQIHIQLHELSHFLFGHPTQVITRKNVRESKAGNQKLPFTDLVKLRSAEVSDCEIEAEQLASLIQEQVVHHSQLQRLTRGISSDEKIAEYLVDLGLI